jgi:CheY-like chemotaxis protein
MSDKIKILVVDDEPLNITIMEEILEDDYDLSTAENGLECLEKARETQPDIILLDINMPEMDGYEACQKIREDWEIKQIPVIFVSALGLIEERMKGYDVGGDDFLVKPFEEDELLAKIALIIKNQEHNVALNENVREATSAAMAAMNMAGEMGQVLTILEHAQEKKSCRELAEFVVDSLQDLGLNTCVQLRGFQEIVHLDYTRKILALEETLLTKLIGGDRIITRGKRLIFTFNESSLLVKNLPEDDDHVGRIRDFLAVLLTGIEARVKALDNEVRLLNQKEQLDNLLKNTHEALTNVRKLIKAQKEVSAKSIKGMLEELEFKVSEHGVLGLDDDQEKYFMDFTSQQMTKMIDHDESDAAIDEHFKHILNELDEMVASQTQ